MRTNISDKEAYFNKNICFQYIFKSNELWVLLYVALYYYKLNINNL